MSLQSLLHRVITIEQDVFAVRQAGREVAAALGLDGQDQVRVATALSEVGRQLLASRRAVDVEFYLLRELPPFLQMRARVAASPEHLLIGPEFDAPRRLMDRWQVDQTQSTCEIVMGKQLPLAAGRLDEDTVRAQLARLTPSTPLQELAVQNKNLLATLDEVEVHRDDLLRLNAELEETNHGVVALYGQLSDELEATNRGVVALYAELDEKSAQLRDASEAKSRFLANVSHELRAPATAIMSLLRLLLDPRSDPLTDEQRHQLALVRGSAGDLLALVNELLDLAKAESGRLDIHLATVDVRRLFDTLRGTLHPLVTKPTVELIVDDPGPLSFRSDGVLLAQILRNLLTNGIKFTEIGEIRLTAHHRADAVEFVVADTGYGIPTDELERIFEEFYQLRTPAHAKVRGTGLGLPYARRLANLLGGTLTVSSTTGQGSTFTLALPSATSDGPTETAPTGPSAPPSGPTS